MYGAETMSVLMSCFSRLFTKFLQIRGFTCSIDDLCLLHHAEHDRKHALKRASKEVFNATVRLLHLDQPGPRPGNGGGVAESKNGGAKEEDVKKKLREELTGAHRASFGAKYDATCSGALNHVSSEAVRVCLPRGQAKAFPSNNFATMTASGAKGSSVNHSQISVLLGQQELEGRRVPMMDSGKTLPCFAPYAVKPRANGFIADRFLDGLQPQEYFFHCMAGREGLVDTTVKTSRSGYLQRCLVKSLEALSVKYDGTVRDGRGHFKSPAALPTRAKGEGKGKGEGEGKGGEEGAARTSSRRDQGARNGIGSAREAAEHGTIVQFRYGEDGVDPVRESYLYEFGFLVQNALPLMQKLKQKGGQFWEWSDDVAPGTDVLAGASPRFREAWAHYSCVIKKERRDKRKKRERAVEVRRTLDAVMGAKHAACLAQPGEAVGVTAAQSLGEPSTQVDQSTRAHTNARSIGHGATVCATTDASPCFLSFPPSLPRTSQMTLNSKSSPPHTFHTFHTRSKHS